MPEEQQELERSVLDGKDREQLHEIAGAMGVSAPTRMKKADLIDAILDAANGGGSGGSSDDNGDAKPRRIRSARASEVDADPIAALAAEEEALASTSDGADAGDAMPAVR